MAEMQSTEKVKKEKRGFYSHDGIMLRRPHYCPPPHLYISIHACLREKGKRGTRARSPDFPLVRRKHRGGQKSGRFNGDARALHKNQILQRGLPSGGPTQGRDSLSYRCDAVSPEEVHRPLVH